jgi:hypothetical protein
MQTLHRNVTISRLALIVAGRRIAQPFHARTLRVLLPSRAELIPDVPHPPTPPLAAHHNDVTSSSELPLPKKPKKSSKTPPFPKPKGKKPSRKKSKSTQIVTRESKRQKGARKTKRVTAVDGSGFILDDWGKDGALPYGYPNVT